MKTHSNRHIINFKAVFMVNPFRLITAGGAPIPPAGMVKIETFAKRYGCFRDGFAGVE
jgi:hypothetical protein